MLASLGYFWATSLVPGHYNATEMGYADYGGGPASDGHEHHNGMTMDMTKSVADLTGPKTGTPDVAVTLVARKQKFVFNELSTNPLHQLDSQPDPEPVPGGYDDRGRRL